MFTNCRAGQIPSVANEYKKKFCGHDLSPVAAEYNGAKNGHDDDKQ